jgi:ElaA protein
VNVQSFAELTAVEVYEILRLRSEVFFVEQRVSASEIDGRDLEPSTEHYSIIDGAGVAAYLRLLQDAEPEHADARRVLGRVAVRADRRGEGLARALLEAVLERHGDEALLLHSQEYVVPLYTRVGFVPVGEPFVEAGIPHRTLYRTATSA